MKINFAHDFNVSLDKAVKIQQKYASTLKLTQLTTKPLLVAGTDVAYTENKGVAVVCIFDFATHKLIEEQHFFGETQFSYRAGFLAFRELPLLLEAFAKIEHDPDLIFFDGHGIIHPYKLGLASHASFFLGRPTIGVAKKSFIGSFTMPKNIKGDFTQIKHNNDIVGYCLRSRVDTKPIFVSPGNFITLQESLDYVNHFIKADRLPITTLIPDEITKKLKKEIL